MSCTLDKIEEILEENECNLQIVYCDPKTNKGNFKIDGTSCDSRSASQNSMFVCKGKNFKIDYLINAIKNGANSCLSSYEMSQQFQIREICEEFEIPLLLVDDVRCAQAFASKVAWGCPDEGLTIVGITGTKGKTTVATFVESAINAKCGDGKRTCGFIGTHRVFDGKKAYEPPNTTPEPPDLYRFLAEMVNNGLDYCVMEVSSQGIKQNRVLGLDFDVCAITNVGVDHIAPIEHPSVEDYVLTKFKIATLCENLVLPHSIAICQEVEELCKMQLALIEKSNNNQFYFFDENIDESSEIPLRLMGSVNQKNARCALKICEVLGLNAEKTYDAICNTCVSGRMEVFGDKTSKIVGIVDYAHTLESYEAFFADVKKRFPKSYLIAYFGASGGKASNRCVDLPKTASKYCDYIILTTDDPGNEKPEDVIDRCAQNVPTGTNFEKVVSRDEACERAFELAKDYVNSSSVEGEDKKDRVIVCALGKGSESICVGGQGVDDIPITPDTEHVRRKVSDLSDKFKL